MVPPRFVRRLVFTPLLIALAITAGVLSPLLLLVGLLASHGRHRLLRLTVVAVAWMELEVAAVSATFALWVSGNGSRRDRYYDLCGWFLGRVYRIATRAFGLVVEIQEPLNASTDRPVIVLSRHAGPGDSFLIVHFLLNVYGRRPRIVLKAALQLDPALDAVLNRLPNAFVSGSGAPREDAVTAIERLAAGMDGGDAMLIFPEGGNFTPHRRVRAIRHLWRQGHRTRASRARRMENVLPPHLAGTLAAIEAAPAADVIFVAHTGSDDLLSVGDVWRALPMRRPMRARWWRVPYEEIPADGRERWLYDWWETIDTWIADNRPVTE
ncbi:1-acyl-sn-glycerol-3-phosphate acyltransferase [Actinomadura sp. DC4]|uniref:1-acyl-sn-glycerol-3-phosphate acyltransferase n=1 Tax=Actinomadura sp. DC4 TaxID=3055069 RepID=UPI0025B0B104|nr:1-acyl-sn-glycerol-3-phosphate acyltransferase [Actinomadura sp. DC4]MDN3353838.1 1-acyl-sn-glycerol-3-phosphate acyltransferase [Actinomadura sp. DC4]